MAMLAIRTSQPSPQPLHIPHAIGFNAPINREETEQARESRRAKHVLRALGIAQIVFGAAGFFALTINVKDASIPFYAAALWVIAAGLIGLIASFCRWHMYDPDFPDGRLCPCQCCTNLYQAIVVLAVILNFSVSMHSLYVYINGSATTHLPLLTPPTFHHNTRPRNHIDPALSTFIGGLTLSAVELIVAAIIQKTVIEAFMRKWSKSKLQRAGTAERVEREHLVPRSSSPVSPPPPITVTSMATPPPVVVPRIWLTVLRNELPPRYSTVGLPSADRTVSLDSAITLAEHAAVAAQIPHYRFDPQTCRSPPPAFTSRRNTIQSLPPSYSQTGNFFLSQV